MSTQSKEEILDDIAKNITGGLSFKDITTQLTFEACKSVVFAYSEIQSQRITELEAALNEINDIINDLDSPQQNKIFEIASNALKQIRVNKPF